MWLELPEGADATALLPKALEKNVGFVPGGPFFPGTGNDNTIRLNFSTMAPDKIEEGIIRLGELFRDEF